MVSIRNLDRKFHHVFFEILFINRSAEFLRVESSREGPEREGPQGLEGGSKVKVGRESPKGAFGGRV